jgi:integrase
MNAFESRLSQHLESMIRFKKALGYAESSYRRQLLDFDKYCLKHSPDEADLTQELVMGWCRKRDSETANSQNRRVAAIREFGRYLLSVGVPAYVMPPKMTAAQTRYVPHLFTDSELSSFFEGADHFGKIAGDPLASYVVSVIFRLMYCCGLRPGEGLRVKTEDIDLKSGKLFIRQSKRHKDRVVMLSDDVQKLCRSYDRIRVKFCGSDEYFFPDKHGGAHNMAWLGRCFKKCCQLSGLVNFVHIKPRLYDFRHTFATRRLHDWMEERVDLYSMMPYLSAYMGHSTFSCTAYYIHLLPERLQTSAAMDWNAFEALLPEVPV